MILVIASSFLEGDPQTDLLLDSLKKAEKPFVLLNPLDYKTFYGLELVNHELTGSALFLDDRCVTPDSIYLSRMVRADCIIDFPENCVYPNTFRQKIDTFIQEILLTFRGARFFPGSLTSVNLSETKTALFHMASLCGLKVPEYTATCFGKTSLPANYRKALGYPFSITLNTEEGSEVAVTLVNGKCTEDEEDLGLPWQWQTEIDCVAQVRCVVVGHKIHCYLADWSKFLGEDLRSVQESQQVEWAKSELGVEISEKLFCLMDQLGLTLACPEFLINQSGELVFIDMNPSGDWYGLGSDEDSAIIAEEIANQL